MKSKKNRKIKYGKVEIPEDAFDAKNVKARITTWIGMDLLSELRKRAGTKGMPYQTYMNQLLREAVFGSEDEERIRKLIREELAKKTA